MIDLRSDTLTKPSPAMLEAMFSAQVGDDVFGEDPSVIALESMAAAMFGMEAALFCTSGTQTNQLAIMAQTIPGQEVICDQYAHIFKYEGGGMASNANVSARLVNGDRGRLHAAQVKDFINNPADIHQPITAMIAVENTMNKGGGAIYDFQDLVALKQVCLQHNLVFHLDGARLFNALVETSQSPMDYGQLFDSISICLSKGLGAPVGSLLLGSKDLIMKARRIRKRLGGGWRQAGYLAQAGIFALKNNIERLREDHANARQIGEAFASQSYIKSVYPVETNIVIIELKSEIDSTVFLQKLKDNGILAVGFGPQLIRFVTHLDFTQEHLQAFLNTIKTLKT
jgi:threonine aldolase